MQETQKKSYKNKIKQLNNFNLIKIILEKMELNL